MTESVMLINLRIYNHARNTISGLSPTSLNYREAIDILKQWYGNTQVLISSYMKKFVLLPKIVSDNDVKGLRKILDQVEFSVLNLRQNLVNSVMVCFIKKIFNYTKELIILCFYMPWKAFPSFLLLKKKSSTVLFTNTTHKNQLV